MSLLKVISNNRKNPEFQQVMVRAAFFIFGITYIGLGSYSNYYPIAKQTYYIFASLFLTYLLVTFWHVARYPRFKNRVYVTLFLDLCAITYCILLTGGAASPLYIMYVWIFVSQAVRFGRTHLYVSAALSMLGFISVIIYEQHWSQKTFEAIFLIVSLLILPVYIDLMLKKLNIAKRKADEANQAKSAFLANMSHELRTPLNAIIGYSDMLVEDAKAMRMEQFSEDLQKIHMSGQHLLSLISNVLDLSKIEAGKMGVSLKKIDVKDILAQVEATVRALIEHGGNRYTVKYGDVPDEVVADEMKLKQVLINLLGNAAKFTENGQIELAIRTETNAGRDYIIFEVKDNGIGIPEEESGNLFSPFTQVDNSSTREFGGSGLGLSISRSYCRMMGGDLTYISQAHNGSCFQVRLPVNYKPRIESGHEIKCEKYDAHA
jgi:signal transduction histidine kinase